MNGEQIIPPISDPLGKSWQQPHRRFIELDATHALMSEQTFKGLPEYSMSDPSGVYEGRMWKSYSQFTGEWYLRWYQVVEQPSYHKGCCIHSREILIVE